MRISKALLLAATCALLPAAPALAQSAQDVEQAAPDAAAAKTKVKAKAKKKAAPKGKHASDVTVVNARADAIVSVSVTSAKGKTIALVKKSLPTGKKHAFKIPAGNGCDFTVSARFADGTEFDPTPVDLCRDKTLRFTDGEVGGASEAPAPAAEE